MVKSNAVYKDVWNCAATMDIKLALITTLPNPFVPPLLMEGVHVQQERRSVMEMQIGLVIVSLLAHAVLQVKNHVQTSMVNDHAKSALKADVLQL